MKKIIISAFIVVLIFLTGCSATSAGDSGKKKALVVGTVDAWNPYGFLDKDGKPTGFEVEVFKEIGKLLPQYEVKFEPMQFENLYVSLDSGKINTIALQAERNAETEKKYLFTDEAYSILMTKLIVLEDNNTIKNFADAQGKTVLVASGSGDAKFLEQYNNDHKDKPIKLEYISDPSTVVKSLVDKRADAFVRGDTAVITYGDAYGVKLKAVGDAIQNRKSYYPLAKGQDQLKKDLDGALKTLRENGKLKELSIKWLKNDYSPK
ncbi:transporter substrate-binding domain-containing protein [Paenibacillus sp. N3.4]|uniref:transporter substrate-binding domain-containing protein n=1 Tax=Paenibacillus sp. N3.4 TaxID=2603222 RepID=UPI0011C71F88|nr:transporter substrate-binding domain-containing protein [Paenibacillus sp. N3.4]TXK83874.1 transporter substrate-binding domain-containing protein [Paenibacillus sp. N3.4]